MRARFQYSCIPVRITASVGSLRLGAPSSSPPSEEHSQCAVDFLVLGQIPGITSGLLLAPSFRHSH